MIRALLGTVITGLMIAVGILGIVVLWLLPATTDIRDVVVVAATALGLLVGGAIFAIPAAVADDLHLAHCDKCRKMQNK